MAACVTLSLPLQHQPHYHQRRPLITCAGVAWSSRVHVLGIVHESAANAWSVHEVARAVKPDAVGFELDSSDKTLRNRITKAAQSAPMMKLINRLMDTPLESYQQAHGQLTAAEREEWKAGLSSARIGLGSLSDGHHLLGMPAYSDPISGVRACMASLVVLAMRLPGEQPLCC
jgi:hypothetical protein